MFSSFRQGNVRDEMYIHIIVRLNALFWVVMRMCSLDFKYICIYTYVGRELVSVASEMHGKKCTCIIYVCVYGMRSNHSGWGKCTNHSELYCTQSLWMRHKSLLIQWDKCKNHSEHIWMSHVSHSEWGKRKNHSEWDKCTNHSEEGAGRALRSVSNQSSEHCEVAQYP